MSGYVTGWVLKHVAAPPISKLLLVSLADEANDDGYSCHPSQSRLAAHVGVSLPTIRTHLDQLETAGLIVVVRPERSGRGHFNRYGVVMGRDVDAVRSMVYADAGRTEKGKPVTPSAGKGETPLPDNAETEKGKPVTPSGGKGETPLPDNAVKGKEKGTSGFPLPMTPTTTSNVLSVYQRPDPAHSPNQLADTSATVARTFGLTEAATTVEQAVATVARTSTLERIVHVATTTGVDTFWLSKIDTARDFVRHFPTMNNQTGRPDAPNPRNVIDPTRFDVTPKSDGDRRNARTAIATARNALNPKDSTE